MGKSPRRWKKRRAWFAVVCIVGSGVWFVSRLIPNEPTLNVALRSTKCVEAGDSDCIFGLMYEKEKKAQGITRTNLRALFDAFIVPNRQERYGPPITELTSLDDSGIAFAVSQWSRPNKPPVIIGMAAAITPKGPRTVNAVRDIIFGGLDAKYRKSSKESKIVVYLEGMVRESARLSSLGFTGLYNPNTAKIDDWPTIIDSYRQKIIDHHLQ